MYKIQTSLKRQTCTNENQNPAVTDAANIHIVQLTQTSQLTHTYTDKLSKNRVLLKNTVKLTCLSQHTLRLANERSANAASRSCQENVGQSL